MAARNSSDWEPVALHTPMVLQIDATAGLDGWCDATGTSCSVCGVCSANATQATLCVGEDGSLFGSTASDCASDAVLDRTGECCPREAVNCAGFCDDSYAVALDRSMDYAVCCLASVGIGRCDEVDDRLRGGLSGERVRGRLRCVQWRDHRSVCGVESTIDHVANSDMDCLGVCFGNYTQDCAIEMHSDSTEGMAMFDLEKGETQQFVNLTITNQSDRFIDA